MVKEIINDIKKGLGISIGIVIGFSFLVLGYAFVEPSMAPTNDNYVSSGSKIMNLLTGINNSVSSSGGWNNCEVKHIAPSYSSTLTVSCSSGKSIRDIAFACSAKTTSASPGGTFLNVGSCGVTFSNSTQIDARGDSFTYSNQRVESYFSGTIICCDD